MPNPLRTELALPSYAGLTDAQAAAALNAPIAVNVPVDLAAVKLLLYQDATPCAMLRLAAAAQVPDATSGVDGLQVAAQSTLAYLSDPHMATIDFTNAAVAAGLALLVQGGVLGQDLAAQVQALGQTTTTRARQISAGAPYPVATIRVTKARAQ